MKRLIEKILLSLARAVLHRQKPLVIGVTGSVGKSSTKEAAALILEKVGTVRKSEGNYNNEFGLPLTILGEKSGGKNPLLWFLILLRGAWLATVGGRYPTILVLEMGVDRPGDMDVLVHCAEPSIGVLTGVSGSHLAFFGTLGNIAKEKGKLITTLPEDGFAILNADDTRVIKLKEKTKAKVLSYGFAETAEVRAEHVKLLQENGRLDGMSFKLSYNGTSLPVRLPEMIGRHHIHAILAAAAIGIAAKMNLVDIADALIGYRTLPGRLTLLPGRDGMRLIDDTYNASPASTKAALAVMKEIIAPRRVVVLGDMLEIGETTFDAHRSLARDVLGSGANVFVGVGRHMRHLADALKGTSFPQKNIFTFLDPTLAATALVDIVRPGDLILVKGSQGLRMEKIVETLLADRDEAENVLCRQSVSWKNKPFVAPDEWMS